MNKVVLIGRLTKDPELRYTSSNVPCCTFSIAVNRNFTNQNGEREADFINVQVWKKMAENCSKYLAKGSQVAIDGRIQTRSYDTQDGSKRYVTEVIAENVQFLDSKNSGQGTDSNVLTTQTDTQSDIHSNPFQEMHDKVEQEQFEYDYDSDGLPF